MGRRVCADVGQKFSDGPVEGAKEDANGARSAQGEVEGAPGTSARGGAFKGQSAQNN